MPLEQDTLDALEDANDKLEEIKTAIQKLNPTVVVNVPKQPAPDVKIQAGDTHIPKSDINFSPTIEAVKPTSWKFHVTDRDSYGRIKSFTATPAS